MQVIDFIGAANLAGELFSASLELELAEAQRYRPQPDHLGVHSQMPFLIPMEPCLHAQCREPDSMRENVGRWDGIQQIQGD